jgi:hypothetical protein
MPKNPINYQQTIIYKLCCKDTTITEIYVGHTTNFTRRKYQHHHSCYNENNKGYNLYLYQFIRENGDWDNWNMIEIEVYSCENKRQAETRERYWIEELHPKLNKNIPTRTIQEWTEENKKYLQEYRQDWRDNNEEHLKKCKQEWYENNKNEILEKRKEKIECECGCIFKKSSKSRHVKTKKHLEYLDNLNR